MLKIFNILTKKKEVFKSIKYKLVNMYVCGITAYDFCHIGHGRTFVVFDMITRYLNYCGYKVKYIRNITDIDDKLISLSVKKKISISTLVSGVVQQMKKDFLKLGILSPYKEPYATFSINTIIEQISILLKKKHAYIDQYGDVLFSLKSYPKYGFLSGVDLIKLKKVSDFVLWKRSKVHEPFWRSPWGKGRPGWHIECSAMIQENLKNKVDIHGGGADLLFPHHENELAQSCSIDGNCKINYWMHSGMVIVDDQKMSKSLNNFFTLRDVLKIYNGEVIRYFFLLTHYRKPIVYTKEGLQNAYFSLKNLYYATGFIKIKSIFFKEKILPKHLKQCINFKKKFFNSMNDDFNSPKAISILFQIVKKIYKFSQKNKAFIVELIRILIKLANILGILLFDTNSIFLKKNKIDNELIKKIDLLIKERERKRICQDWKKADFIRDKLYQKYHVILKDFKKETIWFKINKVFSSL